jgi:hypothetical protein
LSTLGLGAFAPGLGKEAGFMATSQIAEEAAIEDKNQSSQSLLKDIKTILSKGFKNLLTEGESEPLPATLSGQSFFGGANFLSMASSITDTIFGGGLTQISEDISNKATMTEQKSDTFIGRAIDTAKSVIQTVWDSITGTAETHESAAFASSEKSSKAVESATAAVVETIKNNNRVSNMEKMQEQLISTANQSTSGVSTSVESKYEQMNTAADGLVVPAAVRSGEAATSVNPIPLTDVHSKVHQENVATSNEARKSMPELSDLVMVNESQLQVLVMMHGDLEELIAIMKPNNVSGNTGGPAPSTDSNTSPVSSPNYRQWQFGKYQQNASKQVITDGR